jgi:hypothetical protein
MNTFTIDNETNEITLHASPEAAETVPHSEQFTTAEELLALSEKWSTGRLIQIWNTLPGNPPVKKFTDRKTAVNRIWKALQVLEAPLAVETVPEPSLGSSDSDYLIMETAAEEVTDPLVAAVEEFPPPSIEFAPDAVEVQTGAPSPEAEATVDEQAPDVAPVEETPGKKAPRPKKAHTGEPKAKTTRDGSKTATVVELMKREGGVTLKAIMEATNWQAHSVRGFISGTLTKKLGLAVISTKGENGERTYTIG